MKTLTVPYAAKAAVQTAKLNAMIVRADYDIHQGDRVEIQVLPPTVCCAQIIGRTWVEAVTAIDARPGELLILGEFQHEPVPQIVAALVGYKSYADLVKDHPGRSLMVAWAPVNADLMILEDQTDLTKTQDAWRQGRIRVWERGDWVERNIRRI